jgi:NAD(P)-dependent dehydrogenase (short-subunit alcohol dehydrogenase family)
MTRLTQLSRSIEGKVAIVTGAASGMGRATACLFADEGARVAAIDINEAPLEEVVSEIAAAGAEVRGWTLDVADPAAIERTFAEIVAHFGVVDILVNNAGISIPTAIEGEGYEAAWQRSLDVLLTAHTRTIRAALPALLKSDAPRIVNVASTEVSEPVHRCKARRDRIDALPRGGARRPGHYRELHLPRTHSNGNDRSDSRSRQAGLRAPSRCAAALCGSGGGRARDVEPGSARGLLHHRCYTSGRRWADDPQRLTARRETLG